MVLRTVTDGFRKIRTNCLQAQQCPEIITVIPVVALVPARASALPPPIDDRFMLSIPLHRRCQHWQVPLPGLCRVPAPHLLQDMSLNSNRRGRKKPMFGVLHRRVEPSFRMMVNFRVVTPEHLFQLLQRLLNLTRLLGNQRTHHPHTWHRETDNRFQSYEAASHFLSSYTIRPPGRKRACTIRAGNDKEEVVVFHGQIDSFFRVLYATLRSYPYSAFTRTDDFMSYSHWHFFPYHTLHHKRLSTYLFMHHPPFLFLSFSRTKGYTRAALSYSTMITMTHTSRVTRCSITKH